jgi:hypothetical protein
MLQSLFYLTIALHVSGIIITHLQEHKTIVTLASGNRYTVLLSVAIVEKLKLILVCCGWPTSSATNSNQIFNLPEDFRDLFSRQLPHICSSMTAW